MKKIFVIFLILIFSSEYLFAKEMEYFSSIKSAEESFELEINANLKVNVILSENLIKTENLIIDKNLSFQIDFHIQNDNQPYYIELIHSKGAIRKSFNARIKKKNGLLYYIKNADYDLDYLFPRERDENATKIMEQFSINPDFTNNDQIINYSEELFRIIRTYVLNNIGTISISGIIINDKELDYLYYRFDDMKFSPTQKIKISNRIIDNETKKNYDKYFIQFNRSELKNYQKIYFSNREHDLQNPSIINQNSINITELKRLMLNEVLKKNFSFKNDLFLNYDPHHLISKEESVKEKDREFLGSYVSKNKKIELLENYFYHYKEDDIEEFGNWKIGESGGRKAIMVYNTYRINNKTGERTKKYSFNILIIGTNYCYPLGSGVIIEFNKE